MYLDSFVVDATRAHIADQGPRGGCRGARGGTRPPLRLLGPRRDSRGRLGGQAGRGGAATNHVHVNTGPTTTGPSGHNYANQSQPLQRQSLLERNKLLI